MSNEIIDVQALFFSQAMRRKGISLTPLFITVGAVFLANNFLSWSAVSSTVLKGLIGYGYYPFLALLWSTIVVVIGWAVVRVASAAGVMKNTSADSTVEPLSPFLYSLNVFLPVIDLHQEKYWWPGAGSSGRYILFGKSVIVRGHAVRLYLWCQIIAGWVLSAFFIAGISGLIKHGS